MSAKSDSRLGDLVVGLRSANRTHPHAVKAVLVGEDNPYSAHPRYALFPEPERSAGGRLCRVVLGLDAAPYLALFARVNLCVRRWSALEARERAVSLIAEWDMLDAERRAAGSLGERATPFVLLGRKVSETFAGYFTPYTASPGNDFARRMYAMLPHPSGLNRMWNEPRAVERARETLARVGAMPTREEIDAAIAAARAHRCDNCGCVLAAARTVPEPVCPDCGPRR